ncbi:MAG TPA: TerC family protein [Cytophagaceae bacterium]|nr:TerC family protein [Cytophagaceae bacterium]
MLSSIFSLDGIMSFLTLTVMEIVLGIDNIIFISILTSRIKQEQRSKVRLLGLSLALVVRLVLLGLLNQMSHIESTLFSLGKFDFAIKNLIFFAGGLFLIYKSTSEIHSSISGEDEMEESKKKHLSVGAAILQIILLDLVFSFDSILTAVGLSGEMVIMSLAVFISMLIMLFASKGISKFINDNPSVKILALSFLMTIGVMLVAEAFHQEIPKGYIYYSLAFSLVVEALNLRAKKNKKS